MIRLFHLATAVLASTAPLWLFSAADTMPSPPQPVTDELGWMVLTNERFAVLDGLDRAVVMRFKFERWRLERTDDLLRWVSFNDCRAAERYADQLVWPRISRFFSENNDRIFASLDARFVNTVGIDLGSYDAGRRAFPIKYFDSRLAPIASIGRFDAQLILGFSLTEGRYSVGCDGRIPPYFMPPTRIQLNRSLPGELVVAEAGARMFIAAHPASRQAKARMVVRVTGSKSSKSSWGTYFVGRVEYAVVTANSWEGGGAASERLLGELVPAAGLGSRAYLDGSRENAWPLFVGRLID